MILSVVSSCSEPSPVLWTFKEQIPVEGVSPVGIAVDDKNIWLSDPDNNRLVKTDLKGYVLKEIDNLQRPMHVTFSEGKLYVPEYLTDTIRTFENDKRAFLPISSALNAPAGIAVDGSTIAIADFYNHRVILKQGDQELIIGNEGHGPWELYYPTDVAIYKDLIYVADAYNNRIQVFDKKGKGLRIIGEEDNIQVATGIEVADEQLFVTDFDGDRMLVYDLTGTLIQVLSEHFVKPADISFAEDKIIVVNYSGQTFSIFEKKTY